MSILSENKKHNYSILKEQHSKTLIQTQGIKFVMSISFNEEQISGPLSAHTYVKITLLFMISLMGVK